MYALTTVYKQRDEFTTKVKVGDLENLLNDFMEELQSEIEVAIYMDISVPASLFNTVQELIPDDSEIVLYQSEPNEKLYTFTSSCYDDASAYHVHLAKTVN